MDVGNSLQRPPAVTETAVEEPVAAAYPDKPGMWLCDHVRRVKSLWHYQR